MTIDPIAVAKARKAIDELQARQVAKEQELVTYEGQLKERDRTLTASEEAHRRTLADYPTGLFAKLRPVYPGTPEPKSGERVPEYLSRVSEVFAVDGKDSTARRKTLEEAEENYKRRETVLKTKEEQVTAAFKELEGLEAKGDTAGDATQKPQ